MASLPEEILTDEEHTWKSSPARVLVVDDDLAIRKGMVFLLRKEGYETLEAEDGAPVLDLVLGMRPDLILLDLMMPKVDGLVVCRQLKSREETRLIPVVMITAVYSQDQKIKAIEAGADEFLNKPVSIIELRARVKSLLRMKRLNDFLDRSDNVIASLANAIEAKDKYTEGHNSRVARYAVSLARSTGLSKRDLNTIQMAGILHDVGKIGVPDNVLNKPGPLNNDEFSRILAHPGKGEKILEPLQSLSGIREAVLYHHERYDGKGYPEGLKGEGIPLYARIIAIADSYDAMTTDRPYRKGLSRDAAAAELKAKAGVMWDPALVERFIELLQSGEIDGKTMEEAGPDV